VDREAIRLMRQHGIISMAAWVAGFVDEKDSDYWRTLRQLMSYDPDQIQALYATPHSWTPFARQVEERHVIQTDLSRWDYKHHVLESEFVTHWRVALWVKFIEAVCQLRPKAIWRLLAHPDARFRAGMRWYSNIGRRVWIYEVWQWIFCDRRTRVGPALAQFLRGPWRIELGEISGTPWERMCKFFKKRKTAFKWNDEAYSTTARKQFGAVVTADTFWSLRLL
jgi:anaerobic magnesium-protoporphyrin IX monomethyl ester cyclase